MQDRIKIPKALELLIIRNNEILQTTQEELMEQVLTANEELMKLMNLDPKDGWRIDMSAMEYVKLPQTGEDMSDTASIVR